VRPSAPTGWPRVRRDRRYWSTHVRNNSAPDQSCEHDCTSAAIAGFDDDLRQAFERLAAVLIASTHPLDVEEGDDGWWELPAVYAEIEDSFERAQVMRDDVNGWIQAAGIWVYANTGTADSIDELKGKDLKGSKRGPWDRIHKHLSGGARFATAHLAISSNTSSAARRQCCRVAPIAPI
jgi:hypothetical protein